LKKKILSFFTHSPGDRPPTTFWKELAYGFGAIRTTSCNSEMRLNVSYKLTRNKRKNTANTHNREPVFCDS